MGEIERFSPLRVGVPESEYHGLIAGLEEARLRGIFLLDILGDSEVVVDQIMGRSRVQSESLLPLYQRTMELLANFPGYKIRWIPRNKNIADRTSREE